MWKPTITRQERLLRAALKRYGIQTVSNAKIAGYYPDLHIVGTNILIEVDGSVHYGKEAKERDRLRTQHLNLAGYRVLRFTNKAIETSMQSVIVKIYRAIETCQMGRSGIVFRKHSTSDTRKQAARRKAKELNQMHSDRA